MAEEKQNQEPTSGVDDSKVMALLSYIGILFLIPMLVKPNDEYVQFHVRQGVVFFIFGIILSIASAIPVVGWFIIAPVGGIFTLVLFILGIVNALTGKTKPLPIIGKYADVIFSKK